MTRTPHWSQMTREVLYKLTGEHGQPVHGGRGAWPLPTRAQDGTVTPGEWREVEYGPLKPCRHGLHLVRREDLPDWVHPGTVWSVETEGRLARRLKPCHKKTVVARRARLLAPVGRLTPEILMAWATECVARAYAPKLHGLGVLPHTSDMRSRRAVEAARRATRRAAAAYAVAAARDPAFNYAKLAAAAAYAVTARRHAAYARAVVDGSPDAEADAAAAATTERQWQAERLWTLMGASR